MDFNEIEVTDMNWQAKWIWVDTRDDIVNQYADFRKVFSVSEKGRVVLYVSADSSYQIWINGDLLEGNQFSDWPQFKTYNEFDITDYVCAGENVFAVKVHHIGVDFSTYAKGHPGLIFEIRDGENTVAASDDACMCRYCNAFGSGHTSVVSPQLGYNFKYDARLDDLWYDKEYDAKGWSKAVVIAEANSGYWKQLSKRPLEMLAHKEPLDAEVVSSGQLIRSTELSDIGQTMMKDFLSPDICRRDSDGEIQNFIRHRPVLSGESDKPLVFETQDQGKGVYAIFDLGAENCGLLFVDIEAPQGCILDIAHGEHLDDLRVRASIDERTFADRYICKEGRQRWVYSFRRLGCRYLELHVPELNGQLKINHFTVIPVEYPFAGEGCFYCPDEKFNRIWELSKRTLELCAHEHYEDCPWREQALYAADSRLQALFGYYAFGEYDMPASCWDLIRKGYRTDGLLELVSPGKVDISIPGFSLQWIIAVYECFMYSGRKEVVSDNYDVICDIINYSIDRLSDCGIVANSTSPEHWNFYEWTPGFEGIEEGSYSGQNGRLDAAYNLYLLEAIRNAVEIGRAIGANSIEKFEAAYDRISSSFNDVFWDQSKGLYASFNDNGQLSHYSQLVQALAIREAVVPPGYTMELCEAIKNDSRLTKSEMSSKFIVYESLIEASDENINYVLDDIRDVFGSMIDEGATSLWETAQGAAAFEGAGSLCHGWSSVFNYIAGAYLVGIKPAKPGFKEFKVKPLMNNLNNINGLVKTIYGDIELSYTKTDKEVIFKLTHPKGLKPVLELPSNAKLNVIEY